MWVEVSQRLDLPCSPSLRILPSPFPSAKGCRRGLAVAGDLLGLAGPWTLPPPPAVPFSCTREQGVHRTWLPICPPPVCAAHASTRSQTSKNVKHVDARSGGRGRCLSAGRWARGLLPPPGYTRSHPHPLPRRRKGSTEGPEPPPQPSPGAV